MTASREEKLAQNHIKNHRFGHRFWAVRWTNLIQLLSSNYLPIRLVGGNNNAMQTVKYFARKKRKRKKRNSKEG